MQNSGDTTRKFCLSFNNACDTYGLLDVLRRGFKHRGISFRVCYFKPESGLNQTAAALYQKNEITCNRQWFYSTTSHNSVDMMIAINGIPVFAFEQKNQHTGQSVDNAKRQWMYDCDPREICFQFNKRILGYFCLNQLEVWMTRKLDGKNTCFLPFNQGTNGAGQEVDAAAGRNYAIIVHEAHSSQSGSSSMKLKSALADTEAALREYAEVEGKSEDEIDQNDKVIQEM